MPRLVYSSSLICEPLFYEFLRTPGQSIMTIEKLPEMQCLDELETSRADFAMLTPLAYAKSKGNIYIVKDFLIHSPISGRNVLLFLKGI